MIATTSPDRRAAARRQPTIGTVCRLTLANDEDRVGLVWNISTNGLSMLIQRPPEVGAVLDGVLQADHEGTCLAVRFRVAHVRPLRTGDYVIGGPFVRALVADELQSFVA